MLSLRIGGGNQKLEPLPWMHFAELIFPASDAFPIDIAPGSSNSLKSKFSRSFTDGGHHRNAPIRVKFNILTPTARNMKADRCTLQSATHSLFFHIFLLILVAAYATRVKNLRAQQHLGAILKAFG